MAFSDGDEQCRMLAGSCRRLQSALASRAMEALESGEEAEQGPPVLLSAVQTAASVRQPFSVVLPQGLADMQLA